MANSIALFKQFVPLLDEVYKEASKTAVLDGRPELVQAGANANELVIPKMTMDGLADYSRNGGYVGEDNIPRLNVLDLQRLIRVVPKPVIAMVNGYAIGGGHVLHILCDLSIAAETAKFGQTGPKVGSFDAGYGAGYLAAMVGQKKAREIWYLCRQYTAQEALDMGMVNKVVPFEQLEEETVQWAREMLQFSPTALRFMKASFNAATDGLAGLQQFAGDATLLYYTTDEAKEGRDAFKEKRKPDFSKYPKFP